MAARMARGTTAFVGAVGAISLGLVAGASAAEGNAEVSARHVAAAQEAAGDDLTLALGNCKDIGKTFVIPEGKLHGMLEKLTTLGPRPPVTVFDNLHFVGTKWVSAWAIETSDGIILFDALNNAKEAKDYIEAGLEELGLDPADIKKIIVAHAHGDHYGGAKYLQDTYGPEVIMSALDWAELEKPELQYADELWDAPPERDVAVDDGDTVTLGDTTAQIVLMPGHTVGTIGIVFDVMDGDEAHKAVIWGGNGLNFGPDAGRFLDMMHSADKVREMAAEEGIDVFLSNHPGTDGTDEKAERLANRKEGDPHPFVIGTDGVERFMTALRECVAAQLASFDAEAADSAD
ncbi:MBL fold metallo-hydrolase [Acuticoccus sediminis]|uniref:MBL fold metallo-hydrolase n=1 Tax=Acuticoccus sediminis TaxID=2184697 RepID=UPI001CFDC3A1|nr:MBL fold metallo-hydrolase [Acuticoccus sediminis]